MYDIPIVRQAGGTCAFGLQTRAEGEILGGLSEQYREQEEERARTTTRAPLIRNILTSVGVPVVGSAAIVYLVFVLLPPSGPDSYEADRLALRHAVLAFTSGLPPDIPPSVTPDGFEGQFTSFKGQLPTYALAHLGTEFALEEAAAGSEEITTLGLEQSNPIGLNGQAGTPFWEDADGDGLRIPIDEKLFYHNADPSPSVDHWNTATVVFKDVVYVVDSRDWFIDVNFLVEKGYLEEVPPSASRDNSEQGTGNYSWYVDENGEVMSLLYATPTRDSVGYNHHDEFPHVHPPWDAPH